MDTCPILQVESHVSPMTTAQSERINADETTEAQRLFHSAGRDSFFMPWDVWVPGKFVCFFMASPALRG